MTVGQAVSNAAETYNRHEQTVPGGTGEIIMPLDHLPTLGENDQDEQPYPHRQSHAIPPPHDGNLTNVDITGYSFAFNLNDGFYAERQQLEEEQWQARYHAMFTTGRNGVTDMKEHGQDPFLLINEIVG
ncbi:hypothetical protein DFH28DRAFT_1119308 [Melampsora americana]|nr:hypothetical protein DFH28DRAFT_1119308 [Melampsora americana]